MASVGTITCRVCGKPVDRWDIFDDPANMQTVMRVFCHGAEDRMTISTYHIEDKASADALRDAIARGGEAFRAARIEGQ